MNPRCICLDVGNDHLVVDAVARRDVNPRLLLPCRLRRDEAPDLALTELVEPGYRHLVDGRIGLQDVPGAVQNGLVEDEAAEDVDQYMDRAEAPVAGEKIKHVPVKVFGGLVLDKSILDGAGHILQADPAIDQMTISGLDKLGEREVE